MKHLVLIGGGHSHAIALRQWSLNPVPGIRLTAIADVADAPYSGMLPGHIAGRYSFEESHINLKTLAQSARAALILDRAIGLDLNRNRVLCLHHPPLTFDWLSIDTGSTPAQNEIPGAKDYTIPAKPVPQFLERWNQLLQSLRQDDRLVHRDRPLCLGIVGGGAGGVELALAMQARLAAERPALTLEVHLFHRGDLLMDKFPASVGLLFQDLLAARGIQLHLGETVTAIELARDDRRIVRCESGLRVQCDRIFWLTQAAAPDWPREAGLATDAEGFILVGNTLQSVSHPHVFATGDIAAIVDRPRPKAGVFAVRQGKPLAENLRRVALGQTPNPFYPQKRYLSLIGTGDGRAVAVWGGLCVGPSQLLWAWKDWIDRQFMAQFERRSQ
ncbi:FAD-dependent oxidoreductase [Altericista sp. CCNU0014]|uniref:FAD-dependent oxidoreductase n=1 Tax=Altericista sp. CCNU0014 TaxID=3082949 RepID=UPI00384EB962